MDPGGKKEAAAVNFYFHQRKMTIGEIFESLFVLSNFEKRTMKTFGGGIAALSIKPRNLSAADNSNNSLEPN